jgi:hypothetical protein
MTTSDYTEGSQIRLIEYIPQQCTMSPHYMINPLEIILAVRR